MPGTHVNIVTHKNVEAVTEYTVSLPLWQRVPTRTETGERAFDFMIIVRRLNKLEPIKQKSVLDNIYSILSQYSEVILLADLNLKINLLWISHLPRPNLSFEITSSIIDAYPLARLISHRSDCN
ncbi:hypothetical protein MNBD_GAMMA21-948 [hydrothermal vent metagenome]|uniref:Uncharacterized protein n=1 Tax=hydrothermal vent metagenome TaxID=652676 RepID=A0A3B0ZNQ0_9ZZZZ